MKRYRLHIWPVWLLLGMLFLTACQNDALPEDTGSGKGGAVSAERYINLRIVGNSQAKTRATFSDQATAAENAVYDGILCIFEGDNETSATLKTAVAIDQLINNPGSTANSQDLSITQRLADGTYNYSNRLYVLALLNTTSTGFKIGGTNKDELLFNGESKKGSTISQIQQLQINSVGSTDQHVGLFMSNAPQTGYIMPEVTSNYIYETKAAAATGSRLTINVERAAARVKVTNETTAISAINLDGDENRHPTIHRMTWALNKYNTTSYAVRNGSTAADNWATSVGIPIAFDTTVPDIFDVYRQHAFNDGDDVYIAENTTSGQETEVIVEVQLKEGSFLLGDCYKYDQWGQVIIFFTSSEAVINYCKEMWTSTFAPRHEAIASKSAEEVFKYPSFVIHDNGTVTLTLKNESFTNDEKIALSNLSNMLSGFLTGYRDGKMYYTYKIKHDTNHEFGVVRNNAYNLTLQNSSVTGIGRPIP